MGIDARMLVQTMQSVTDEQILDWSWRLAEAFGLGVIYVHRPTENAPFEWRAIEKIIEYIQDGPTLIPREGETFLLVSLWGRYYGVDYERGDLISYLGVAVWLEENIPGADVWYGGDSCGVCAEPFGAGERMHLMRHFCQVGHTPYYSASSSVDSDLKKKCEWCNKPMLRYGFGDNGNYAMFYCPGCGSSINTRNRGKTWEETERETR